MVRRNSCGSECPLANGSKSRTWSSRPRKKTLFGLGVGAVVAIVVVVTLAVVLTRKPTCNTDICKQTAKKLKEVMDESVDPCDDFYMFACGKFMKRYEGSGVTLSGNFYDSAVQLNSDLQDLMNFEPISSRSNSAVDKALNLFRGCKSAAKYGKSQNQQLLYSILRDNMNGCQFLPDSMTTKPFNWYESIAKIIRNVDQNFVFSVLVLPDPEKPENAAISLYPETPEVIKGLGSIMRAPPAPKPQAGAYASINDQIRTMFCVIDQNCVLNFNLNDDIKYLLQYYGTSGQYSASESDESIPIKTTYSVPQNAGPEPNSTMETMTIEKLQKRLPQVNWLDFFTIVFNGTSTKVSQQTMVTTSIGYLTLIMDHFIANIPPKAIQLYLGYKFITKYGPILFNDVRRLLTGQSVDDKCMELTNGALGFAVGNLYNSKFVTKETYNETMRLVLELKGAFRELLQENSWMDDITKANALRKIDNMVESVSTPDWAKDSNSLDEYYEKMGMISESSFQESFKRAMGFAMVKNAELLKQPIDRRNFWPVKTSAQTNAFYFQNANTMMFPSGILTLPFFAHGRPSSMNYGSFGYIAGHEITHGFDNSGRTRDEEGRTKDWWSPASLQKFIDKSNCFIKQYSNIYVRSAYQNLDGNKTLGENIADNGGIREAFRAHKNYQKKSGEKDERLPGLTKYDQDQLFYISAGYMYCTVSSGAFLQNQIKSDNHSPNQYRITVPFQNSEDFSKAFNCKKNEKMNPSNKCVIW